MFLSTAAAAAPPAISRVATASNTENPASPKLDGKLLVGNWAGDGYAIGADKDRATVQSGCSHGRTDAPIALDKAGSFAARGYFNAPHSGYRLGDIAPRDRSAMFSGKLQGKTLLLTVAFNGDGGGKAGPHKLVRDGQIKFPKCPS